jgi:hypothetical protein
MNVQTVVRVDHVNIPDWDYHEWIRRDFVKADVRGRLSPRMWNAHWLLIVCNNPDCPAEALINVQGILEELPR